MLRSQSYLRLKDHVLSPFGLGRDPQRKTRLHEAAHYIVARESSEELEPLYINMVLEKKPFIGYSLLGKSRSNARTRIEGPPATDVTWLPIFLAGPAVEEIEYGFHDSGCRNDWEVARKAAVVQAQKEFSDIDRIDQKARKLQLDALAEAKTIIRANIDKIYAVADALEGCDVLDATQIETILSNQTGCFSGSRSAASGQPAPACQPTD